MRYDQKLVTATDLAGDTVFSRQAVFLEFGCSQFLSGFVRTVKTFHETKWWRSYLLYKIPNWFKPLAAASQSEKSIFFIHSSEKTDCSNFTIKLSRTENYEQYKNMPAHWTETSLSHGATGLLGSVCISPLWCGGSPWHQRRHQSRPQGRLHPEHRSSWHWSSQQRPLL